MDGHNVLGRLVAKGPTGADEQFLMFNVQNPLALRDNVRQSALEIALLPQVLARLEVDTSRPRVRERFAELERERRAGIARDLRRLHVDHVSLSTDRDWLLDLGRRLR